LKNLHRTAILALSLASLCLAWGLLAQMRDQNEPQPQITLQGMSPQELQMLRHDLRKQKQKLIGENLPMSESEAIKFWAVYQKYAAELKDLDDERFAMLHTYAQNWRSMSNDDSLIFMRRWLEIDEKVVQLRSRYLPLFKDVLPGKKAATFFQLDERITMMINLEFTSQLPLLHGAPPRPQAAAPAD
jgi:hypothetical protein